MKTGNYFTVLGFLVGGSQLTIAHAGTQSSWLFSSFFESSSSNCQSRMIDAIAIQDSSASLKPKSWDKLVTLSEKLADTLSLSEGGNRLGVISYADEAYTNWTFDDPRAQDIDLAKSSLHNIPYYSGNTNTPTALDEAYEILNFASQNDQTRANSDNLNRLVFLSTDGCSNRFDDSQFPNRSSHLDNVLKKLGNFKNLHIIAFGIGDSLCKDELRRIAGCEPESSGKACPRAIFSDWDSALEQLKQNIEEICEEMGKEEDSEGGNVAAIAGGVIGGVVLLGGAGAGAAMVMKGGSAGGGKGPGEEVFEEADLDKDATIFEEEEAIEAEDSMFAQ